jgi:hypothetical protein
MCTATAREEDDDVTKKGGDFMSGFYLNLVGLYKLNPVDP